MLYGESGLGKTVSVNSCWASPYFAHGPMHNPADNLGYPSTPL
jgi:hypothetical protein